MRDIPGNAVKSFSVASGLLAHIHLHEAHSKAIQPPDEVQQPPLSNNAPTCNITALNAARQATHTACCHAVHALLFGGICRSDLGSIYTH